MVLNATAETASHPLLPSAKPAAQWPAPETQLSSAVAVIAFQYSTTRLIQPPLHPRMPEIMFCRDATRNLVQADCCPVLVILTRQA